MFDGTEAHGLMQDGLASPKIASGNKHTCMSGTDDPEPAMQLDELDDVWGLEKDLPLDTVWRRRKSHEISYETRTRRYL
jgi:hypothetical protein